MGLSRSMFGKNKKPVFISLIDGRMGTFDGIDTEETERDMIVPKYVPLNSFTAKKKKLPEPIPRNSLVGPIALPDVEDAPNQIVFVTEDSSGKSALRDLILGANYKSVKASEDEMKRLRTKLMRAESELRRLGAGKKEDKKPQGSPYNYDAQSGQGKWGKTQY